jgi:hypothetical protein
MMTFIWMERMDESIDCLQIEKRAEAELCVKHKGEM